MRKIKLFFISLAIVILCFAFAPKTYAKVVVPDPYPGGPGLNGPVDKITITDEANDGIIGVKSTETLTCTFTRPFLGRILNWSSSDNSIATVDSRGNVTGVSLGTVTISAYYNDKQGTVRGSITLTVKNIPVFKVLIKDEGNDNKVDYARHEQLSYEYFPSNATPKEISWYSSNPMIAQVNSNGVVTGTGIGTTYINIQIKDYNGSITKGTIRIEVKKVYSTSVKIYSGGKELDYEERINMKPGETKKLTTKVLPENVTNDGVIWESSNPNVAIVDDNGEVKSLTSGTTILTATTKDSYYRNNKIFTRIKVTVKAKWTIMIYLCPEDRESGFYGKIKLASGSKDIAEIMKVGNQPNDINIIIQTGETTSWYDPKVNGEEKWYIDRPAIPENKKTARFFIRNEKLVFDPNYAETESKWDFYDFLSWGLNDYPAEKTGVIMVGHGNPYIGACEITTGFIENAYKDNIKSKKLEFIAYNSCMMGCLNISKMNKPYFNYMVASEDFVYDSGFDYTKWLDYLYKNKDKETLDILESLVNGYKDSNPKDFDSSNDTGVDTMSILNLNKASYADHEKILLLIEANKKTIVEKYKEKCQNARKILCGKNSEAYKDDGNFIFEINNVTYTFDLVGVYNYLQSKGLVNDEEEKAFANIKGMIEYNSIGTKYYKKANKPCGLSVTRYYD